MNRPVVVAIVAALAVTAIFVAIRTAPPRPPAPHETLASDGEQRSNDTAAAGSGTRRHDDAARTNRRRAPHPRPTTTTTVHPSAPTITTTTTVPRNDALAVDVLERCRGLERSSRFWATRLMHLHVRSTGLFLAGEGRDLELAVAARRAPNGGGDALVYMEGAPDPDGVSALLSIAPDGERRYQIWIPALQQLRHVPPGTELDAISHDDLARIAGVASWCDLGSDATLHTPTGDTDAATYAIEFRSPAVWGVDRIRLELGRNDLAPVQIEYDRGADEPVQRIRMRDIEWAGARPVPRIVEAERGNVHTLIETVGVEWDADIPDCLFDVTCTVERPHRGACCRR